LAYYKNNTGILHKKNPDVVKNKSCFVNIITRIVLGIPDKIKEI